MTQEYIVAAERAIDFVNFGGVASNPLTAEAHIKGLALLVKTLSAAPEQPPVEPDFYLWGDEVIWKHSPEINQCIRDQGIPLFEHPPKVRAEPLGREAMLKYYSDYANKQTNEIVEYQKRIRELEAEREAIRNEALDEAINSVVNRWGIVSGGSTFTGVVKGIQRLKSQPAQLSGNSGELPSDSCHPTDSVQAEVGTIAHVDHGKITLISSLASIASRHDDDSDRNMLDWLCNDMSKDDDSVGIEYIDGYYCFPYLDNGAGGLGGGVCLAKFDSLRDAIKAAMRAQEQP